jgi:hypothetical protein
MDNVVLLRIAALLTMDPRIAALPPMDPRNRELLKSSADEIERLRRDVKEANARAYVMAKEVTLWQSRAALKEGE